MNRREAEEFKKGIESGVFYEPGEELDRYSQAIGFLEGSDSERERAKGLVDKIKSVLDGDDFNHFQTPMTADCFDSCPRCLIEKALEKYRGKE